MEARWPKLLLGVLIALPLGVFAWRVSTGATPSAEPLARPWVSQLWITAGDWPVTDGEPAWDGRVLAEFSGRSTRLAQAYAPTLDPAVNAAAMFTGLWPLTSGFLKRGDKVDPDKWNIVQAARSAGMRSCAFSQVVMANEIGFYDFDVVVEAMNFSIDEIVDAVSNEWQAHPEAPSFMWVHLREAGDGAANVARLLEGLTLAGLDDARRVETLIAIVGLSTRVTDPPSNPIMDDARFRVPVVMALPGDLAAGREGVASASLIDLPWAVIEVTKWPQPVPALDARPSIIPAMQGAYMPEWCVMLGPENHILRRETRRYVAPGLPPAKLPLVSVCEPTGKTFTRTEDPAAVSAGRIEYRNLIESLLKLK